MDYKNDSKSNSSRKEMRPSATIAELNNSRQAHGFSTLESPSKLQRMPSRENNVITWPLPDTTNKDQA
jgi:hypothetical protein